jgi:hypothetical protein
MIELNGQTYPSEVRSSQAVQLETQDTPAGSSEFPGLSEELALGRQIMAGEIIETGDFATNFETFKSGLSQANNEGEDYDGTLPDPAGHGAPISRPRAYTPQLELENQPISAAEKNSALALLNELQTDFPTARVLRFIRYLDDKRVVLVFTDGADELQLQQQYHETTLT